MSGSTRPVRPATQTNAGPAKPGEAPEPADVLVFVPGLGASPHLDPRLVADLLCWEMKQRAADRHADFAVDPTSVGGKSVYRIERIDHGISTPVLDLYCQGPADVFADESSPASALRRVVTLALTVFAGILIWVSAWFRSGHRAKSFQQMLQLLFCLFILLVVGTYFLIAVYALVEVVAVAVGGGAGDEPLVRWPQWAVLVAAVAAVLVPDVRNRLTHTAELYQRMMRYLWGSAIRNRLTGRLQDLVDQINRRPGVKNIHLLGFSFGSLVVLDTVYPVGAPHPAQLQQVTSIYTIGCPFDLVRMLQPSYAKDRTEAAQPPPRWTNVYAPTDLLASNFRSDDKVGDPERGFPLPGDRTRLPDQSHAWNAQATLNLVNLMMLHSVFVHGQYWDSQVGARTALGTVVETLFREPDVLR